MFNPNAPTKMATADSTAVTRIRNQARSQRMQDIAFAPQRVATGSMELLDKRMASKQPGITTGIASLDNVLLPMRPGEMIGVLGFTSNGKSALLSWIARHWARQIAHSGAVDHVVVSITWEQSVEEQGVADLAQLSGQSTSDIMRNRAGVNWDLVRQAAITRGQIPWWIIGHSSLSTQRRPMLTMAEVADVLSYMVDDLGLTIDLLLLDYLQRIPGDRAIRDRRERFVTTVDNVKDLSLMIGCPVVLGSQAGRQVKDRSWQMPMIDDAQETSNYEQSCDKIVGVYYPRTHAPIGEHLSDGQKEFTVTSNLFLANVLKQKFGEANVLIELWMDPAQNLILPTTTVQL